MGFMEQAAAKLARKFGTVSTGKHEGCQIALGNDPNKKVEASFVFTQIIFLQDTEEKGRYDLIHDLKAVNILGVEEYGLQISILFADGEVCQFLLETAALKNEKENPFVSMIKVWFGLKKNNLTPEQARQENVKNIKIFVRNIMELMDASSVDLWEEYLKVNDVLEDLDKKLIANKRKALEK